MIWKMRVKLMGHEALQRTLRELPDNVAKKGLKKVVNAGAQPVVKAYRSNLKTRASKVTEGTKPPPGLLEKSIKKKVVFYPGSKKAVAIVGADRSVTGTDSRGRFYRPSKIAHLVEDGAKPHVIVPKSGPWKGRVLNHPGVKGTKALSRAVSSTASSVRAVIDAKTAEVILDATSGRWI